MREVLQSTSSNIPIMEGKRIELSSMALLVFVAVFTLCWWYFSQTKPESHAVPSLTEEERRQRREKMATLIAERLKNAKDSVIEAEVLPENHSEDLKELSEERVVNVENAEPSATSITAKKKTKCVEQLNEAETVLQPITGVTASPHEEAIDQVRPSELVPSEISSPTQQRPASITPKKKVKCLVEQIMESDNDRRTIEVAEATLQQEDHIEEVSEFVPVETSPPAKKHPVSRENEESEILNKESIQDTYSQIAKAKRKKVLLPPPQVLCEALCHVFKCRVTAEPKAEAGTWGGEGWIKRRSDYANAITITLPLYKFRPSSMENEWLALCVAFPNVLDSSSLSPKLLQNDVRKAIACHSRANGIARKGFTLLMKGDNGWNELRSCLEAFSHWLAKEVAFWIRPEAEAARNTLQVEDEISDLFSDDYNTEDTQYSGCSTRPYESLFGLLEETWSVVTGEFMEDLFRVYTIEAEEMLEDQRLPEIFLSQVLNRLAMAKQSSSFSSPILTQRIMAVSNLLTMSSSVRQTLALSMRGELEHMKSKNGRDIQSLVRLAVLFEAAAYAVPAADTERQPGPRKRGFLQQLESVQDFPVCVFLPKRGDETGRVMEEARRTMKAARQAAESSLRVAFKIGGKDRVFQWLASVIRANEPLVNLLKSDLLESDGVVALSSTRDFLLGLTSTLVSFCHTSLGTRFEEMGADAFDAAYLSKTLLQADEMNRLFQGPVRNSEDRGATPNSEFAGSTHFFFLSCLMMRVALHPTLRMNREFHFRYDKLLTTLRGEANSENASRSSSFKSAAPVVAAWLGWKSFLEDPDFASSITDLVLVQLGWLVAIAGKGSPFLSLIPDWMCREPARWMSQLAYTSPFWLKPRQAEKAVEYATALLDYVTTSSHSGECSFAFSPIVVTSLIQIISSFVQAGVTRARRKQQRRLRRGFGSETGDDEHEPGDDRDLDVYSSFDQNDLGVAVFTNRVVQETLCPVLVRTFLAVDVVEGYDADRDDSFNKFSAKSQIAELFLRLWAHPSGECRKSVTSLSTAEILHFASSISTAAGVMLDFAFGSLQKVYMSAKGRPLHTMVGIEKAFVEQQTSSAVGQLLGIRRFLALLCAMSEDERIASYLGGQAVDMTKKKHFLLNLSSMIVHFLEKMTSRDGGTNQSLEEGDCEPTSKIVSNLDRLSTAEKTRLAEDVVSRRIRAKIEYGLDVGVFCHQLLALATKWHLTSIKLSNEQTRVSAFLAVLAEHEDCDLLLLENVFKRLVMMPNCTEGSEVDNASAIFEHDGYVDHAAWEHKYIGTGVSEIQKGHHRTARQDQMKHADIAKVASNNDISVFIDDLRRSIAIVEVTKRKSTSHEEVAMVQESILSSGGSLAEDGYGECLSEWVVSSAPFRCGEDDTVFSHSYDKVARSHGAIGSGKTLVKEAKKCDKTLPLPNASSAIYVCFAEERMDLCRVVVSGPVDTPYAHGLFEFDVYFPLTYPHIPPLVTFMTTGGGQFRFNPNLYVDGKVCISLLGVTYASDESQRWNPEKSSLAQLMISIQSQIIGVKEPYFNEGNGVPEAMKHTPAGREGSTKYNNDVRLATLRYAMVGHLRSPPKGFEEVTLRHFATCRQRIVVQARLWMLEARDTYLYARYERAYSELLSLLAAESMKKYESLAPLPEDMKRIEMLEPSFLCRIGERDGGDRKPSASESAGERPAPVFNAWPAPTDPTTTVNPWAVDALNSPVGPGATQDDSDDELYT